MKRIWNFIKWYYNRYETDRENIIKLPFGHLMAYAAMRGTLTGIFLYFLAIITVIVISLLGLMPTCKV